MTNPTDCCRSVQVDCCPDPMPDVVFATISDHTNCGCADGVSIALAWTGVDWQGEGGACGAVWRLVLSCVPAIPSFMLGGTGPGGCGVSPNMADPGWSCSPINLAYTGVTVSSECLCDGPSPTRVSITVTE